MSIYNVFIRAINRNKVIFIFLFLFFISIFVYYNSAVFYSGLYTTELRSAYEITILGGLRTKYVIFTLILVGPLIVSFAFGDIYFEDLESNCIPYIFTRGEKKIYHRNNLIVVFFLSFMLSTIPLLINLILCLLTYPMEGIDNSVQMQAYVLNFDFNNKLALLKSMHPLGYNILYTGIIGTIFSLFSCLTYSISITVKKNKYLCSIISYSIYIFYEVIVLRVGKENYSLIQCLNPIITNDSLNPIILISIGFIILITLVYSIGIKKEF